MAPPWLEVMVTLMLARERPAPAGAAAAGCTALAAALIGLPSGLLEMIAEAVAALGYADVPACARPAAPAAAPQARKRRRA